MHASPPNSLHVVAFDVPYPPDYGGAVDVFYKLKALHRMGCSITLHCFKYGRAEAVQLSQLCHRVYYYPRTTGIGGIRPGKPYIVSSRRAPDLLANLAADDAPILFEGVHTCHYLDHPALQNKFKALRVHNIEHQYYAQLAGGVAPGIKKAFFLLEAAHLKRFEAALNNVQAFFALSQTDSAYFKNRYPNAHHSFVSPFHSHDSVESKIGTGTFCLYHGNLSHPENIAAARFLLDEVALRLQIKVVFAGKAPHPSIAELCKRLPNCALVPNPDEAVLDQLVSDAHIHILPTFQTSGMKLKLLHALYGGRYVVANPPMLHGTGLTDACIMATTAQEFTDTCNALMTRPFTATEIESRRRALAGYDNLGNARRLMQEMGLAVSGDAMLPA